MNIIGAAFIIGAAVWGLAKNVLARLVAPQVMCGPVFGFWVNPLWLILRFILLPTTLLWYTAVQHMFSAAVCS